MPLIIGGQLRRLPLMGFSRAGFPPLASSNQTWKKPVTICTLTIFNYRLTWGVRVLWGKEIERLRLFLGGKSLASELGIPRVWRKEVSHNHQANLVE
jgi:hypothetical protein